MARRIRVKPTKTISVGTAVLKNENELVISDADFSGLSVAQLNDIVDLGPATVAGSTDPYGGTTKSSSAGISLGSFPGNATNYVYVSVPDICKRGLMSRLIVTPSAGTGAYDLTMRSESGGAEKFLEAVGVTGVYDISIPVYVEGDASGALWFGIKNQAPGARVFTLTTMRVEKFA